MDRWNKMEQMILEAARTATYRAPCQATNRAATRRPGRAEKADRAFQAYLDLLDTADWLSRWVRGHLRVCSLTSKGFRVLEILHRHGPQQMTALAKRCSSDRRNADAIVRGLVKQGHVTLGIAWLPAADIKASHMAKRDREKKRRGPRVAVARLTREGEEFFRSILPQHKKVVRAFMMGASGREQQTLSAICEKIREGSLKFFAELIRAD
jgi:DNA-binding MarR family transcriptional regulator